MLYTDYGFKLCCREYRLGYVHDVYCVRQCSVLNMCPVVVVFRLLRGSVMSVYFGLKSLNHGQEQNKDEQNLCWPYWS